MYKLKIQPSQQPIDLDEAKAHLRVTGSEEENLISNLIVSVCQEAEKYLNRTLVTQSWYLYLDEFPDEDKDNDYCILLHKCPIQKINSIKYYDSDGTLQTWDSANYSLDSVSEPARISLAYGVSYPGTREINNAVIVDFDSGYGLPGQVPEAIKSGMYLYLSYLYDNRGDQTTSGVPHAVWNIWNNYRVEWL